MPTEQLLVGTSRWVYGRFRDEDGILADPTTVTFTIEEPDGTETDFLYAADVADQYEHVSEGVWRYLVNFNVEGAWLVKWTATGDVAATDDTYVIVRPSGLSFTPHPGQTCAPWATLADVCSPCDDYDFDIVLLGNCLQWATDILYDLTKRRWPGECTELVRPCAGPGRREAPWAGWAWDAAGGRSWCGCATWNTCGCSSFSEIVLPRSGVTSVTVTIDGIEIDPSLYQLYDGFKLVYQPDDGDPTGRTGWPCCQDFRMPLTEVGTWAIDMTWGSAPPVGGIMSAAILGCQLALGCQPETVGQCRLPKRVTSITRQGIVVAAVLDPLTLFAEGLTGIPEVDLWVASANRGQASRGATVFMPGQRTRQSFRRPG